MRIVFMGSAPLACVCLDALLTADEDQVVGVVCQPDRPKGRSLKMAACPVKPRALAAGLPVMAFENVNASESVAALAALQPDLIAVVAYGQILRKALLALPPRSCVNIHASLLPRYRGAAPIQWAIARGEAVTGVTSMYMSERMDAGDIIRQSEVRIEPEDTAGSLHDKLAAAGAALLLVTLRAMRGGQCERTPQDESRATYAPKLRKEDGRIDWTWPARDIHNRVRGFNPWPGCFCAAPAQQAGAAGTGAVRALKLLRVRVEEAQAPAGAAPGQVIETRGAGPVVAAGAGSVRLLEVQPEGGRAMEGAAYLRGHGLKEGTILQ